MSLILRICRPLFGSDKASVLDILFCIDKGTTELEAKGVYAADLIKKRHCFPKVVPG